MDRIKRLINKHVCKIGKDKDARIALNDLLVRSQTEVDRHYRMPDGGRVSSADDYFAAWRAIIEPIEQDTNSVCFAFDPDIILEKDGLLSRYNAVIDPKRLFRRELIRQDAHIEFKHNYRMDYADYMKLRSAYDSLVSNTKKKLLSKHWVEWLATGVRKEQPITGCEPSDEPFGQIG